MNAVRVILLASFGLSCCAGQADAQERLTLRGHTKWVQSIAVGKDGKTLASGSFDETLKIWDVVTGKELKSLTPHKGTVYSAAFSPDGKLLASGGYDAVARFWNVVSWEETASMKDAPRGIWKVAFSPDGSLFLSVSSRKVKERWVGVATVWETATRTKKVVVEGNTVFVGNLLFSPNGHILASATADGFIQLWDIPSGKERLSINAGAEKILALTYDPTGKSLAAAVEDRKLRRQQVRFWDTTGKQLGTLDTHTRAANCLAYSPDGKTLAVGSGRWLEIWDLNPQKLHAVLEGHKHEISCVVFNSDGKTLITGSHDNTIKLWDVPEPMDD